MCSTKRKTANMVTVERSNSSSLLSCISPVYLDQPSLHRSRIGKDPEPGSL